MTGYHPTMRYLPDLGTNVTQLNATVMTAFRQRSSSSPMLWIPYILIGVSCVVFLAVHFWCYHKRNRQRYLRKREEKRVKCGLMERRRITTLMVARYQSDLDFSDIAKTEVPGTINGDLHRLTDHSVDDDDDESLNGNIQKGRFQVDIVPEHIISPASGVFVPEESIKERANGSVGPSQRAYLTPNLSSVQDVNLVLDYKDQHSTNQDMTTTHGCLTCLPSRPVSVVGEGGHYSWGTIDHHDDEEEEDAASAPHTPMSPDAFSVKSHTTAKASRFPNIIYTTLSQSHPQEKLSHLRDRSRGRKQAKESFGDLYEYNMNVESPTDLGACSANDSHVLADLRVDTLNYLDCNHKHDSLWRCTPPRASPEKDLDSMKASPNITNDRRSKEKSTREVKESGCMPPVSDLQHGTERLSAAIISSNLNSLVNCDITSSTLDNADVSISSNTVDGAKALQQDLNVHHLSERSPHDTSVSFPKQKFAISTEEEKRTCLQPTPSEDATNF